jgi:hypothetical protein
MKIEKAENSVKYKLYENKTWRYLVPSMRVFGEDFVNKWGYLFKVACGIFDYNLSGIKKYEGNNIYCLVDTNFNPESLEEFILFCLSKDYYINHYQYKNSDSNLIMFVFRLPESCNEAYNNFLLGKYSKMYTKKQIEVIFPLKTKKEANEVLSKDYNAFVRFQEKFFDFFGENITDRDVEYDLPLINKEEIFNFNKDKPVFFDIKDKIW